MPGLSFTNEQINDQAVRMGLADERGRVLSQHRSRVVRALADIADEPPEPVDPPDLQVTVEVTLGGRVIGASVTHVPLPPEGPHRA